MESRGRRHEAISPELMRPKPTVYKTRQEIEEDLAKEKNSDNPHPLRIEGLEMRLEIMVGGPHRIAT